VADRIIDNPIINSPYRVPEQYFRFDDEGITNEKVAGRRPNSAVVIWESTLGRAQHAAAAAASPYDGLSCRRTG
jgi:hypothetical protein